MKYAKESNVGQEALKNNIILYGIRSILRDDTMIDDKNLRFLVSPKNQGVIFDRQGKNKGSKTELCPLSAGRAY